MCYDLTAINVAQQQKTSVNMSWFDQLPKPINKMTMFEEPNTPSTQLWSPPSHSQPEPRDFRSRSWPQIATADHTWDISRSLKSICILSSFCFPGFSTTKIFFFGGLDGWIELQTMLMMHKSRASQLLMIPVCSHGSGQPSHTDHKSQNPVYNDWFQYRWKNDQWLVFKIPTPSVFAYTPSMTHPWRMVDLLALDLVSASVLQVWWSSPNWAGICNTRSVWGALWSNANGTTM